MIDRFFTRLKHFQLPYPVPEGIKGIRFLLYLGIRYLLCLLSSQLFSLHSKGPENEQKWGTLLYQAIIFVTIFLIVL